MNGTTKTIGKHGEIVIPKSIRKEKGLNSNSKVQIVSTKSGILIIPIEKDISQLAGLFGKDGAGDIKELYTVGSFFVQ